MQNTNVIINSESNPKDIAKQVNKIRLANKNNWYQITFEHENKGEKTRLKCYDTWIQLTEKPIFPTVMDVKPTQFKLNIEGGVKKLL